jgi:broad specificity phosphatase PhoE
MIYLVRHGETEFNIARRHQGHVDSQLTQLGRRQATGAGRALAGLVDAGDTVIFSSPLGRALMTAEIIADTIGITAPIIKDCDLKEIWMGSAEGMTEDEMSVRWPRRQAISATDSLSLESPDGEHLNALSKRLSRALMHVAAHHAKSRIVVSHGVAGRVLSTLHLGLNPAEAIRFDAPQDALFRLEPGKITRVSFEVD